MKKIFLIGLVAFGFLLNGNAQDSLKVIYNRVDSIARNIDQLKPKKIDSLIKKNTDSLIKKILIL